MGKGEISRLLMGGSHYHSDFRFQRVFLEPKVREVNQQANGDSSAVFQNYMDFFGSRHQIQSSNDDEFEGISQIPNIVQFAQTYRIVKGKLKKRKSGQYIVVTYPNPFYSPTSESYKDYCKYQYIKYAP